MQPQGQSKWEKWWVLSKLHFPINKTQSEGFFFLSSYCSFFFLRLMLPQEKKNKQFCGSVSPKLYLWLSKEIDTSSRQSCHRRLKRFCLQGTGWPHEEALLFPERTSIWRVAPAAAEDNSSWFASSAGRHDCGLSGAVHYCGPRASWGAAGPRYPGPVNAGDLD